MKKFSCEFWADRLHGVLRLITGLAFMQHGLQKVFGLLGKEAVQGFGKSFVAGHLEMWGGLLVMIGLFTRPVSFVLSGLMAFAYFMAHAPQGFWPVVNKGELAVLYCFIFLFFSAAGGGGFSVDRLLKREADPVATHPPTA